MRTKTIKYNPNNYTGKMAGNVYGGGKRKIKESKTIVRDNPRKTVTKTTNYGPINYYGKQTKTKTKTVVKK